MIRILKGEKITGWGHSRPITPFGLNIENRLWPIPCRSVNVAGGLTCLVFFGILVRPGTDLGQEFSNMAYFYVFFYMVYFLIINLLFYVTYFFDINLFYVTFILYMLVLSPLSGASYCTVYLFIILISLLFLLLFCYYVLVSLQLPVQVILFTV